MMWFAYSMVWLSTAIAVSFGIYVTGSASCIWFMCIPLFVSFTSKKEK